MKATGRPPVVSHSPGCNPKVLLDEVTGDGKWQQGDEEYRGHIGDDTQGGHTQQGGAGEAFQRGGDVLVNRVCVCGKPVEDAAERSRLKQPENSDSGSGCDERSPWSPDLRLGYILNFIFYCFKIGPISGIKFHLKFK